MLNLAPADWLILLIYGFFVISAGISIQSALTGSRDYLHAGRAIPAWLCGLAFAAAGLGIQASIALGSLGAHYGFASVPFVLVGGVVAMVFAGLYMMPVYYGSNARTVPEYLGLRFDTGTRIVAAVLFLVTAVTGIALSLSAVARIFSALHVFDQPLRASGMESRGDILVAMAVPAVLVLAYVLLGGLGATIYNQVTQLFLLAAGLLPVVFLGLKQIGGWTGLKTAAALADGSFGSMGGGQGRIASFALAVGVGLASGFAFWCSDFRVLQSAMAAKDLRAAQRTPLIAAAAWLVFPFLLLLPGMIALGMHTPRTTIEIHNDNGAIYHEITVVPPADENGQGLVPAVIDPATQKPLKRSDGHNQLDYGQAVPNVVGHFLPMGLLGLGIAGLLACMMSGIAAGVSASQAVFSVDLYQLLIRKQADEKHLVVVGRITAAGTILLAFGVAFAASRWHWDLGRAAMILGHCCGPLVAIILLGMFCRSITARGVFAGLMAGIAVCLLPMLSLLHSSAHPMMSGLGFAVASAATTLLIAVVVSLLAKRPTNEQPSGVVYSARVKNTKKSAKKQRLEPLAIAIVVAAIVVALIFI